LQHITNLLNRRKAENEDLKEEIDLKHQKVVNLNDMIQDYERQISEFESKLKDREIAINELREELSEKAESEKFSTARKPYQDRIQALQDELDTHMSIIGDLKSNLSD